ncbi:MAG TPA: transglutaminase domain-containing protein [Planctomycetota bacterium]|nr:transglutaminase domain-containing protein [Planctomycetota bacterium]
MKSIVGARLSLTLTATLAALALQLAQDSSWWTAWCFGTGLLALLLIDQFKILRPIPAAWGFVPILLAALYCAGDWQWNGATSYSASAACVHFILLCQTAAIYSDLAGPQIGMSLAGSLVLLLVAVKQHPSAWHLPLLALLLAAATAGLIFRAVLTREREFQAQMARGRSAGAAGLVPADRRFAGRIAAVTLVLSLCATGFGLFGFFFFPRVSFAAGDSGTGGKGGTDPKIVQSKVFGPDGEFGPKPKEGEGPQIGGVGGLSDSVRLDTFGKILTVPGVALHLTREKIDASKPLPGGFVYLRSKTLTHYEAGGWRNDRRSTKAALNRQVDDPRWYRLDFEKDKNQLLGSGVSELLTLRVPDAPAPQILFVPGAADALDSGLPSRPDRVTDGSIMLATVSAATYKWLTQIGSAGLRAEDPTPCAYPYGAMTGVDIALRPGLLELAGRAKGSAVTDQAKALAILHFLRETGEYKYTLDLPAKPENYADPIEYFLLESKRGHCACFATGYIILARLNNLACRLATGYAVHVDQDGTAIEVKNDEAHAWVEVYLADRGWVTVDPTPAGANAAAVAAAAAAGTTEGKPLTKPDELPKPDGSTPPKTLEPEPDPITTFGPERQSALYDSMLAILTYRLLDLSGLSVPVWLVLLAGLVGLLSWRLRQSWLRREDDALEFGEIARVPGPRIAFYRRMLAIMKSRGYIRRANQSATEFALLIARRGDRGAKAVAVITNVYLLMRFGALPEGERKAAWKKYRPAVEEKLKDLELLRAIEKAEPDAPEAVQG